MEGQSELAASICIELNKGIFGQFLDTSKSPMSPKLLQTIFPIGIDSDRFIRALESPRVQDHIKELKETFTDRKASTIVMLGVDRLDMIKGIPQKILAFEKFLEENSEWREKVVLLQIAVPTRTDVPEFDKDSKLISDRSLDFHKLCPLYAVTGTNFFSYFSVKMFLYIFWSIFLVTSLPDGMNLVSYEFVECQDAKKGVLILSEFIGAEAILVNPWNITDVASAIAQALNMSPEEREKGHRLNFKHVTTHTAQEWAETFVSELNDTVVEAQLRTKQVPPMLRFQVAIERYLQSNNRLLILGFNATLTEPVDTPGRRGGDQIKEMELKLHPELKEPHTALCSDPKTTIVALSGSERNVLDNNLSEYSMWLAAENGMFLCFTKGQWMTTMPEHLNMEWVDSVKHVLEYFTERTPRSHFDLRETSLVWNYKYADPEFGRLQARDMLQHLWTGPISNASVDVVQGSRSVEVRAVGVTKGAAIDRILGEIVHSKATTSPIDYDEDVYTFFEPELPPDAIGTPRPSVTDALRIPGERRPSLKLPASRSGSKASHGKTQRPVSNSNRKTTNYGTGGGRRTSSEKILFNVLDLKGDNYFSCAVSRTRTSARYLLGSSDEVVSFLKELAQASSSSLSSTTQ
ncbi:Glycosyl transferase, family 20 [Dillenia turbinata]|uniref:Glycosyl transferase, family 20 n=1 Tax=Dillenia turbinata TaxID=194707 RepID=A0AAN8W7E0_9MAGN